VYKSRAARREPAHKAARAEAVDEGTEARNVSSVQITCGASFGRTRGACVCTTGVAAFHSGDPIIHM